MFSWLEQLIARPWNRHVRERSQPSHRSVLDFGVQVVDGEPTGKHVGIDQNRRAESVAILGKTGNGKSYLIRYLAQQDIRAGRGFAFFDLHGDVTPFLLKTIAARERALGEDLSARLIVIDLADTGFSVGLNPLESQDGADRFVQIAEFSQILKERWHLDGFGPRTDELLRNLLFVLSESGDTLDEIALFLGNATFRSHCLTRVRNTEIKEYFTQRYDQASDAMRRVLAEPVLNKISLFTSDPRFRHLLGQQRSTFSLVDAMDRNYWIIFNLDKGRHGEQVATSGSLLLAKSKYSFFARKGTNLFTLYCDEVQNLTSFGGGLETMLAEIRKRSGSIVTANQYLAQNPPEVQAALLSVGSFGFFQLAGADAQQIAAMLDGGKSLAERLKNLPRRHLIVKTVNERWCEAVVPIVREPNVDPSDLYRRSRARWARPRREIEEEIRKRHEVGRHNHREALDGWE